MVGRTRLALAWTLLVAVLGTSACEQGSLDDPEYLHERIRVGDPLALRHLRTRVQDPEAKVAAIPALLAAYDQRVQQEEILRILIDIDHPDALPAYIQALGSNDDRLAGLAARGIAGIDAGDQAPAIAQRLSRVTNSSEFLPFFEALRQFPGRPEIASALVPILMRPVAELGAPNTVDGVNVVRHGCEILGRSGSTERTTVEAVLHSLVNFIPYPYNETQLECQLALVQIGDPAVDSLWEMFNQRNPVVLARIEANDLLPIVSSVRASAALAELASPAARDRVVEWLRNPPAVDITDLADLRIEQQQDWFTLYGQMFQNITVYLGRVSTAADDDPGRLVLIDLLNRGEGSPLENFGAFLSTSALAELGLRGAVILALANVGNPADRDRFFELAQTGRTQRGPAYLIRQEAAHAFALMSRPGDRARYQEILNGVESPEQRQTLEAYLPMIEIAESCGTATEGAATEGTGAGGDVGCLAGYLDDESTWPREKAAYDLSHYVGGERAAAALLDNLDHSNVDARIMYVQALRRLPLPQAAEGQLRSALEDTQVARYREFAQQLMILRAVKSRS